MTPPQSGAASFDDRRPAARRPVTLHLGCGRAVEWRIAGAMPSGRLVLVEPCPDRGAALKASFARHDGVEVIVAAVARTAGPLPFQTCRPGDLAALHPLAPAYLRRYPGHVAGAAVQVAAWRIGDLLEALGIWKSAPGDDGFADFAAAPAGRAVPPDDAEGGHRLILETAGEEGAILDDLCALEALQSFDVIEMIASQGRVETPDGTGALSAAAAAERLAAHGFLPDPAAPAASAADPDHVRIGFRRDRRLAAALRAQRRAGSMAAEWQRLALRLGRRWAAAEEVLAGREETWAATARRANRMAEEVAQSQKDVAAADLARDQAVALRRLAQSDVADLRERYGALQAEIDRLPQMTETPQMPQTPQIPSGATTGTAQDGTAGAQAAAPKGAAEPAGRRAAVDAAAPKRTSRKRTARNRAPAKPASGGPADA